MSDTVSAATLVGAVLEQAGYLSQSGLLDGFDAFFLKAGHLVYFIAVVGALTSVALMGSAKMVRYLLIGPIFFWLLVIPRSEIEAVQWKIGSVEKQIGGSSATEVVDEVNFKETPPRVATAFKYYVQFVDAIVAESVEVITAQVDRSDMFFTDRATALHSIVNARISNPTLLGLYDNLLWGKGLDSINGGSACAELMLNALAGTSTQAREAAVEKLGNNIGVVAATTAVQDDITTRLNKIHENREAFERVYAQTDATARVMPNASMRQFLKDHRDHPTLEPLYQKAVVQRDEMSCRDVWNAIAVGAQMEAENIWRDMSGKYREKWKQSNLSEQELAQGEQQLCRDIATKMGAQVDREQHCSLVPLIFINMMRNAATPDHLSRILTRHKERGAFIRSHSNSGLDPQGVDNPKDWLADTDNGSPISRYLHDGTEISADAIANYPEGSVLKEFSFVNRETGEQRYLQANELMDVDSQFDNAFSASLRHRLESVRNSLFAFAMELPYWQGVILYIVAFIYPLWVFVVLVPGRAVNFFRLLLFWLWAKSWDVGFAFVTVYERVLWNLIPSQVPGTSIGVTPSRPDEIGSLIAFYADGLRLDPSYNIYTYYWALSIVVLAIPSITGAAILKGHRAALASFTDASQQMASFVGDRAMSGYGMLKMNNHLLGAHHTMGMARLKQSSSAGGFLGWMATESAATAAQYGGMAAAGQFLKNATTGGTTAGVNNPVAQGLLFGGGVIGIDALLTAPDSQTQSTGTGEKNSLDGIMLPERQQAEGGGVPATASSGSPTSGAGKKVSDLDASTVQTWAGYAAIHAILNGSQGPLEFDDADELKGAPSKIGKLSEVASHGLAQFAAVYKQDITFRSNFDRFVARYYDERVFEHEAIGAAMDPSGGFEMNDYTVNLMNNALASFNQQIAVVYDTANLGMQAAMQAVPVVPNAILGVGLASVGLHATQNPEETAEFLGYDPNASTASPILDPLSPDPQQHGDWLVTPSGVEHYYTGQLLRTPQAGDVNFLGHGGQSPVGTVENYDRLSSYVTASGDSRANEILSDKTVEQAEVSLAQSVVAGGEALVSSFIPDFFKNSDQIESKEFLPMHNNSTTQKE